MVGKGGLLLHSYKSGTRASSSVVNVAEAMEVGITRLAYSTFLSQARQLSDGRSFSTLRIRVVTLAYQALNDEAWQVLKLAKPAMNGARVEFSTNDFGDFPTWQSLVKYIHYVLLAFFNECEHFSLTVGVMPGGFSPAIPLLKDPSLCQLPSLSLSGPSWVGMGMNAACLIPDLNDVVEWLEEWKAPAGTEWGYIAERCLCLRKNSTPGRGSDMVTRLVQVCCGGQGGEGGFFKFLKPTQPQILKPPQLSFSFDSTETNRLITVTL